MASCVRYVLLAAVGPWLAACGLSTQGTSDGSGGDTGGAPSGGAAGAQAHSGMGGAATAGFPGAAGKNAGGGCQSNSDCSTNTSKPVCDTGTHLCVPCVPSKDSCPKSTYCSSLGECIPGCKADADCTTSSGGGGGAGNGGAGGKGGGGAAGKSGAAGSGGSGKSGVTCDLAKHACVGCDSDAMVPSAAV